MYFFRKKQKTAAEKAQALCDTILQLEASKNQLSINVGAPQAISTLSIVSWKKRPNIKAIDKKIKTRIEKLKQLVYKEVNSNRLALSNQFSRHSHKGLQYECLKQLLNNVAQTNAIAKLASDFFEDFENTPFLVYARECKLLNTLTQLEKLTTQLVEKAAEQQEKIDMKEALSEWGFDRHRKYPYGGKHYKPMQQAIEDITQALKLYDEYVKGNVLTRNRVTNDLAGCLSAVSNAIYEHIWQCVPVENIPIIKKMYQDVIDCRKLLQPSLLDTVDPIRAKQTIPDNTNKELKPGTTTGKDTRKDTRKLKRD